MRLWREFSEDLIDVFGGKSSKTPSGHLEPNEEQHPEIIHRIEFYYFFSLIIQIYQIHENQSILFKNILCLAPKYPIASK